MVGGAEQRVPSSESVSDALVEFLLGQPGLLDVVLGLHIDDGSGRCRTCGGPQTGRYRMPCDMRLAAVRAARVRTSRARTAVG